MFRVPLRWLCASALLPWLATVAGAQENEPRETTGPTSFWLPERVFPGAEPIDQLFNLILVLTGAVGVGVFAFLIYLLVRYRHRPGRRAKYTHGDSRVELTWTLIPAAILVMIAAMSQSVWSDLKHPPFEPDDENVTEIRVVGQQFIWNFQYPGADGKLGPLRTDRVNPDSGDPAEQIGLDRDHPDGADDVVSSVMVLPVDGRAYLHLTSVDVIHSFYLPNFRMKQDTVPGLTTRMWLEPDRLSEEVIGTDPENPLRVLNEKTFEYTPITIAKPYDIVCAELCGQGHYTMRGELYVVTRDQYEQWIETEEQNMLATGDEGGGGYY